MQDKLLEVRGLRTVFQTDGGMLPAVDGLSFSLAENEVLAIVGESACGKSVTSLSLLRLVPAPGKIVAGEIHYRGEDLLTKTAREMNAIRGQEISMIFQEPMTSLNPVFPIGRQIMESLRFHGEKSRGAAQARAVEMLGLVGFAAPARAMDRYPHQLSGGMRQRVMIAMALACNPRILIADEPTTALDVTIQAQILRLLRDIRSKAGASIILITHDLGVVAQIAQNVLVMYAGEAVEYADVRSLYADPLHPYTQGLLQSIPKMTEERDMLFTIPGMVPSALNYPKGCRFSPRCGVATDRCATEHPPCLEMGDGRQVRCWRCEGGRKRHG
ncbi:MAG: ABC transporter ATP-binding protein [Oscillospiraceae bacterium]|jgi:oligopeptide/dipeptide ABC transporter ATP-binding protein|nr:ABC transporter ATP-binding protein [Oscillospiraceae bacterium]